MNGYDLYNWPGHHNQLAKEGRERGGLPGSRSIEFLP